MKTRPYLCPNAHTHPHPLYALKLHAPNLDPIGIHQQKLAHPRRRARDAQRLIIISSLAGHNPHDFPALHALAPLGRLDGLDLRPATLLHVFHVHDLHRDWASQPSLLELRVMNVGGEHGRL